MKITDIIFLDVVIRPLAMSDASIVNEFWTYKSSISLYRIMYEIEHFSTYGKR